jgi:hypothetical protein
MRDRFIIIFFLLVAAKQFIIAQPGSRLLHEPKFVSEILSPVSIISTGDESWFADFGKDAFGTLVIRLKPSRPDTIVIHLGEKLSSPAVIDRAPGGSIRYRKVRIVLDTSLYEQIVKLPPDKRNTNPPAVSLPDSFGVIMPFRYCEIENFPYIIASENLKQKTYHYRFDDGSSSFTSSDTMLNRIWDLCKYSIMASSFCGLYIDGDRERIPYEGDALINQLSHYAVDNEYSLAQRTNEYFITHPTWPTEWILHTVILFYYDYLYSGDIRLLRMYYDKLKTRTLTELAREDGLISTKSEKLTDDLMSRLGFTEPGQRLRDIVDWPPAQKDTGWKLATAEGERDGYEMVDVNTVVNAFHYYNLKLMSEIAGWLGNREDSLIFSARALKVKNSINEKLFDKTRGIYTDGEGSSHSSLHANMFTLAFGIVPGEFIPSVTAFIKTRGMACSVYGAQHLIDGLYEAGEAEYALSLLTSTSDRSWWNMIRIGSTITLEAWDMKYKPNSDWNHAWGAAPANIITRRIWGIVPAEPGFKRALIRPQLPGLGSSVISVPTINGKILAAYLNVKNIADVYTIEIPAGMTADFIIPVVKYRNVFVNNKIIRNLKGSIIKLEPGKYDIDLRR